MTVTAYLKTEAARMDSAPRSGRTDLDDDRWCFVCGTANPHGLRIPWTFEDGAARARFRPDRAQQGWKGIVHGGILAALLDEAMVKRVRMEGLTAVTASLEVRYRRPVPVDAEVVIEGRLESARSRVVRLRATICDEDGTCYAEAEGTCVRPRDGQAFP